MKADVQTIVEVENARLIFEGGFDDFDAFNAVGAGYRGGVLVELEDGSRYPDQGVVGGAGRRLVERRL